MVKKPAAAHKKARPEGPGIAHYFDSYKPAQKQKSDHLAAAPIEALGPAAEAEPLEHNAPAVPPNPALIHKQLARLQESDPSTGPPLSQETENLVVWHAASPPSEVELQRAGSSPARHPKIRGNSASKQRLLEQQAARPRPSHASTDPGGPSTDEFLESLLESMGTGPPMGSGASGAAARSPQTDGQVMRTPATARPHSIMKSRGAKAAGYTPGIVTFNLPPGSRKSGASGPMSGQRGTKRGKELAELLKSLSESFNAGAGIANVAGPSGAVDNGAASPAGQPPPAQRSRLASSCGAERPLPAGLADILEQAAPQPAAHGIEGLRQHGRAQAGERGTFPPAGAQQLQAIDPAVKGIKDELGRCLNSFLQGKPASALLDGLGSGCTTATAPAGGEVSTPARPPQLAPTQPQVEEPTAGMVAGEASAMDVDAPAPPGGAAVALKVEHCAPVGAPPKSPYGPGHATGTCRSVSQDDLAKAVSQQDVQPPRGPTPRSTSRRLALGRTSLGTGPAGGTADWGDDDEEDILEALDGIEATALAARQHQAAGPPPGHQVDAGQVEFGAADGAVVAQPAGVPGVAPVPAFLPATEYPKYAGDRAAVHFKVTGVWRDCPTQSGQTETQLQVHNPYSNIVVIAHLTMPWDDADYRPGDPINLVVPAFDEFEGVLHCRLGQDHPGFLVHFPDTLLGGTRIAGAVKCTRSGYLAERVAGEGTNAPCTKGNLYHSLFQGALANEERRADQLRARAGDLAAGRPADLLDSGMTEEGAFRWLEESIGTTIRWLNRFVKKEPNQRVKVGNLPAIGPQPPSRCASVSGVYDIEEYIAAPKFGLKGYIDASVELTMTDSAVSAPPTSAFAAVPRGGPAGCQVVVAPLELKTGRPRDSDTAQALLYLLLMEERYGHPLHWGLLVYKGADPTLVTRTEFELACLMATRNRLAAALARSEMPAITEMKSSCEWCYERTSCMLMHCASGGDSASFLGQSLPGKLRDTVQAAYEATAGHMSAEDAAFVAKWDRLLDLEAASVNKHRPEIWAMTGAEREALGRCLTNLVITRAQPCDAGGWLYTFAKADSSALAVSFPPGEMLMLSVEGRHAGIGRGHLYSCTATEIVVHMDRAIRDGVLRPNGATRTGVPGPPGVSGVSQGPGNGAAGGAVGPVADPSVLWRLDKEEVGTTTSRMRGFLLSLFARTVDKDSGGQETPASLQAARLRKLIVALHQPRPAPPAAQLPANVRAAVEAQVAALALNPEQAEAVRRAVACEDYTLVLGMPGAGKTTAVIAMLRALAAAGKRVLLTSYTNSAVDNVLLKLADVGETNFVRLGREDRVHPGLLPWLPGGSRHGATTAAQLAALADSVPIVGVSALGASDVLVRRRQFDVCIVDEAGQITLPATLGPLLRAKAFVLVGDHHQLPPLVTSKQAAEGGLDEPLFARLAAAHPSAVVTLPVQYRMAADIQVLPNALTYDGQLRCGSAAVANARLDIVMDALPPDTPAWVRHALDPERRVVFLDTAAMESGCAHEVVAGEAVSNPAEARLAIAVLRAAAAVVPSSTLAAISPYRCQVTALERALLEAGLPQVESLTIDRAQGRDKDCVVVSLVRSNAKAEAGKLLMDARRVNVAITRAKAKLVLVGDSSTLCTLPLFERLLGECRQRGWVLPLPPGALL